MIAVAYKCTCMKQEETTHVRYCEAGEDSHDWFVNVVVPALGDDHKKRSPHCTETAMEYAEIEIPHGAKSVGGPTIN